jgi:hypothetical protein
LGVTRVAWHIDYHATRFDPYTEEVVEMMGSFEDKRDVPGCGKRFVSKIV